MRAARIVLVLILLFTMTSTAQAQLMPRRRVAVRVGNMMADFGAKVTVDALNEGFKQATNELGDILDLELSIQIYAQSQLAPRANQPIKGVSGKDRPRQDCLGLLLAETAQLAARLEEEQFAPPRLEKMVLDYQGIAAVKTSDGNVKEGEWSSRKIESGGRSVTVLQRHQPRDAASMSPKGVHCSFAFLTTKEGQEVRKTIDFDLVLDKLKTEGPVPATPWNVKNVEYGRPSPVEGGRQ